MLYEVVDNAFDREHAHRPTLFIHYRQVTVAALLHATDGGADRVLGMDGHGIGRHALGDGRGQRLALGQNATHQVAFGEDADELSPFTNEDAADTPLPHGNDRLGNRLVGRHLPRRRGVQPGDAVDLEIAGQVHVIATSPGSHAGER